MRYCFIVCATLAGLSCLWMTGCGKSGRPEVETVAVSGTVQLDGSPLEGAEVNFLAADYAGVATTDASGKYQMKAQPGENKVYIRKYEGDYDPTMTGSDTGGGGGPKQLVPAKYSDPDKTELKFTVPNDDVNNADFQLTSQ